MAQNALADVGYSAGMVKLQHPPDPASVGGRIFQALQFRGAEVRHLAKDVGVTVQTVYQWFKPRGNHGTKSPSAENVARVARALRVNPFWLATGEEDPLAWRGSMSSDAHALATLYDALPDGKFKTWAYAVVQAMLQLGEAGPFGRPPFDDPGTPPPASPPRTWPRDRRS